jgi:hypothetical protein
MIRHRIREFVPAGAQQVQQNSSSALFEEKLAVLNKGAAASVVDWFICTPGCIGG